MAMNRIWTEETVETEVFFLVRFRVDVIKIQIFNLNQQAVLCKEFFFRWVQNV